jgi:hypothetical protein
MSRYARYHYTTTGQEKPSFMRSFSREERGQAKQSQLLQAKLKPQATLWTPSNSLVSPAWMKNIKRGAGLGCCQLARSLPLLTPLGAL